jgi:hypothetical protein
MISLNASLIVSGVIVEGVPAEFELIVTIRVLLLAAGGALPVPVPAFTEPGTRDRPSACAGPGSLIVERSEIHER